MQNYELLFVMPGTLSEDEVAPLAAEVKALVEKAGAEEVTMEDMGKSRLAYPIKHIRYGYFHLCYFKAEPKVLPEVQEKLRLMTQLLRRVVHKVEENRVRVEKISAIDDVRSRAPKPVAEKTAEEKVEPKAEIKEDVEASRKIDSAPVAKPKAKKTETKAEEIKLDEIDKKLDELLETDIADV